VTRRTLFLVLVLAGACLAVPGGAQLPPPAPQPAPQQPPPPPKPAPAQAPAQSPADFDADAVVEEVKTFYTGYWKAWDDRNLQGVAAGLSGEFVQYMVVPQRGLVQADKPTAVAGVNNFLIAMQGREMAWGRNLLSVVPRSATEAVAAVRNDFTLYNGGGEVELSLEVLRKASDGRWRIVRKWSEKRAY